MPGASWSARGEEEFYSSLTSLHSTAEQPAELAHTRTDLAADVRSPTRREVDECLARIGMARSASSDPSAKTFEDYTDAKLREKFSRLSKLAQAQKDPKQEERLQGELLKIQAELEVRQQAGADGNDPVSKRWLASVSPPPLPGTHHTTIRRVRRKHELGRQAAVLNVAGNKGAGTG